MGLVDILFPVSSNELIIIHVSLTYTVHRIKVRIGEKIILNKVRMLLSYSLNLKAQFMAFYIPKKALSCLGFS